MISGCFFKGFSDPCVEAFSVLLGHDDNLAVKLRGDTDIEPAGKWLFRIFSKRLTIDQVLVNGLYEVLLKGSDRIPLEGHHIPNAKQPPMEDPVVGTKFNATGIPFIC